jgi:hypothetical protein
MNQTTYAHVPGTQPDERPQLWPVSNSGKAITALVLGLLGLFVAGIPFGCVAIGLSISARDDIARGERRGKGLATAAMVLGALDIVLTVVVLIAFGV